MIAYRERNWSIITVFFGLFSTYFLSLKCNVCKIKAKLTYYCFFIHRPDLAIQNLLNRFSYIVFTHSLPSFWHYFGGPFLRDQYRLCTMFAYAIYSVNNCILCLNRRPQKAVPMIN